MQDRADPHARERAFDIARQDPPKGLAVAKAIAEIEDVLNSVGDTCPECPPDCKGPAPGRPASAKISFVVFPAVHRKEGPRRPGFAVSFAHGIGRNRIRTPPRCETAR